MTQVLVKVATPERLKTSYLKDISEGGLFIRVEKPLPVGRSLFVDLLAPGWAAPLRLQCIVTRVQEGAGAGMAVRFEKNSDEVQARLKALVDEYSEDPKQAAAPDAAGQLQHLLGSFSELQTALQDKAGELEAERAKRAEAEARLARVAADLDVLRAGGSPKDVATANAARAELLTARNELGAVRTQLLEREGEIDAYKSELAQLEADEATSRRLATMVAREKSELQAEVARLKGLVAESAAALKATASEQQVLRAENGALAVHRDGLTRDLTRLQAEVTEQATQVTALRQRADAAEQRAEALETRVVNAESAATQSQAELDGSTRRVTSLEASLKEANERVNQLKGRERELRELLAMVGAGAGAGAAGNEVEEPAVTAQPSIMVSTPDEQMEVDIDLEVAAAAGAPMVPAPVAPAASPARAVESTSRDSQLSFDVDTDDASSLAPGEQRREEFEKRLRQNEALVKTPEFDSIEATDQPTRDVKGLAEGGTRLSELMVLGRGVVMPSELVRGLVNLLVAGALRFEQEHERQS